MKTSMVEKLNTKTITSKIAVYLFIIFFIFILPPPSLSFLFLSSSVAILTLLLMVVSLKQQNTKLYLNYHIGTFTIFFLFGLRFWDISIGMSWKMLVCLIPGFVSASTLPFINSGLSERLYAAQWFSGSTNLMLLAVLGFANIAFVLILWQLYDVIEVKNIVFMPSAILGFFFYLVQLMGMQSGIHTYVSGDLQYWLTGKNREVSH
jgi:hypothetical protein